MTEQGWGVDTASDGDGWGGGMEGGKEGARARGWVGWGHGAKGREGGREGGRASLFLKYLQLLTF